MRYMLEQTTLREDHPIWPGETLYKVRDNLNNLVSYGGYTKASICQDVVDKKNGGSDVE